MPHLTGAANALTTEEVIERAATRAAVRAVELYAIGHPPLTAATVQQAAEMVGLGRQVISELLKQLGVLQSIALGATSFQPTAMNARTEEPIEPDVPETDAVIAPRLSSSEIDELAAAITRRLTPTVPLELELWSAKEVAALLKVNPRQVTERYAVAEGFPKPIRLPSLSGGRGVPRWGAADVVTWAAQHREGTPTSRSGRTRKAA